MAAATRHTVTAVEPGDFTLSRYLTRLRRRVRAILLARYLLAALCLTAAVGSIVVLWPIAVPAVVWAAAIAGAAVSVVALVLLRTPDMHAIAAAVDRRLHLADATVTALAMRGSRDPIARLIVRNTVVQLTEEGMARVFPFQLGRSAIASVCTAAVCVVVMVSVNRWTSTSMVTREGGMRIASPGSPTSPSRTNAAGSPESIDWTESSTAPASQPSQAPPTAAAKIPKTEAARGGLADSQAGRPGGQSARPVEDRAFGRGPDSRGTGAPTRALDARGGTAGGGARDMGEGNASGGVQRGDLQADTAASATPAVADYGAAYRTARTRVDTAIARGQIPRSRRAYVRDYFLAIAPRD